MDDSANSTTTPPEPFWHAENTTVPVTTPTPPPPLPPTPISVPPEPTVTILVTPTVPEPPEIPLTPDPVVTPEPPIIPTPFVDPMPPPPPPEPMMRTVSPPAEPVLVIKSKKESGPKVILGVLIFLLVSVAGVLGYMAIQKGGLPFNLGRKAVSGSCCTLGSPNTCAANENCVNDPEAAAAAHCVYSTYVCKPVVQDCTVQLTTEGSDGLCIKADGAQVRVRACLPAGCPLNGGNTTYHRTVANCGGASCAGTCGNSGETRTLTIPAGQQCFEENVGCSVTGRCGNCQVDANNYGERAWQDSGCTVIPTNTPVPTNTPIPTATTTPKPTAPSCSGLTLSQSNITLGQSVTVSANISNYGLIRYGVCTGGTDCRVVDSQNPTTLEKGNSPVSKSFTPTAVGKYVFEVSAYDSSTCNSFCSPGTRLYKNTLAGGGGCDTAGHWADQGEGTCTSTGCIKWLTVIEAPVSPVCLDVTVVKKGTTSLVGLIPGNTIVITVAASGTVSDMATRIKKAGTKIKEALTVEGVWVEQGKKWQYEYIIPANGAGSYEVQGFIKTGGVWK